MPKRVLFRLNASYYFPGHVCGLLADSIYGCVPKYSDLPVAFYIFIERILNTELTRSNSNAGKKTPGKKQ